MSHHISQETMYIACFYFNYWSSRARRLGYMELLHINMACSSNKVRMQLKSLKAQQTKHDEWQVVRKYP